MTVGEFQGIGRSSDTGEIATATGTVTIAPRTRATQKRVLPYSDMTIIVARAIEVAATGSFRPAPPTTASTGIGAAAHQLARPRR